MNIDMIRAAALRNAGHILRTPLLTSYGLDAIAGRRVLVKAEALQITGSFKAGAAGRRCRPCPPKSGSAASSPSPPATTRRAWRGRPREHGVPAVIIMPADAPAAKIDGTRALGAEVVLYDRATEDRDALGARLSAERGLTLIKPFDEPEVIAGQGTTGLEIAAQAADLGVTQADVLVCCGGGGLTSGIALALEADAPGLRVRPVEPAGFDDTARSLASGRIERNATLTGSICDAVLTPSPGRSPSRSWRGSAGRGSRSATPRRGRRCGRPSGTCGWCWNRAEPLPSPPPSITPNRSPARQ
jgi:threonine dehydratase